MRTEPSDVCEPTPTVRPARPPPPGDDRGDPRHRGGRDDRGGRQRSQPLRSRPPSRACSRRRSTSTSRRSWPSTTRSSCAVSAANLDVMRAAMADAATRARRAHQGPRSERSLVAREPRRSRSCCSGGRCRASNRRPRAMAPSVEMVALQRQRARRRRRGRRARTRRRLRRGGLPRLDPHLRRAQPGVRERTRPAMGRRTLHARVFPKLMRAAPRALPAPPVRRRTR